jgi:hypothetical protein
MLDEIPLFLSFMSFLFHLLLGCWWWISPDFRKETKEKENYKRMGIYTGAWFAPILVLFIAYLIIT